MNILNNNIHISEKKKSIFLFFFGLNFLKPKACIFLRKNHSNFFITFTDLKGNVISCKTAAMILGKSERRRRRHAPQTISKLINNFDNFFNLYNIWGVDIILKLRPGQYLNNLIKCLIDKNIKICNIYVRRKLPFSKQRGRRKKF